MHVAIAASAEAETSFFSNIDFSSGAIAAVSGGSDSTALLILLKEHLERFAPTARLVAVTVDHALRPASAGEALAVKALCGRLGIVHRTMVWTGEKPDTGIPAAAREARYRLLAEAARAEGIGMVLTGHTADDQAETIMMRRQRSAADDGRGLAGMAPATLYEGSVWIVRPLLGASREALRDVLRRRNFSWIDDPTNADATYERPRVRAAIGDGGEDFAAVLDLAAGAALRRIELGEKATRLIGSLASQPVRGLVRLGPEFASAEKHAAVYALRILLASVGGVPFLPDEARTAALFDRLAGQKLRATLSRVTVDARRSGIFLHREARGLPEPQSVAQDMVWDGRRLITFNDAIDGLVIAAAGPTCGARLAEEAGNAVPKSLARAALSAEPALWRGAECLGFAGDSGIVSGYAARPVVAPWVRFLPSFDLRAARATSDLLGAPEVPQSPLSDARNDRPWSKT
ncbi:tRNA(Ile)-lysidine synthetase [Mesorhizobium sp. Root552]|jgi:tRNA(Ile)-lysidine synthase|uniref:tRNA lysidine(34) synthetase TilS n=1 Tax=Mesorhizobium sp. Root552 TaxID=1736555 RepID=UPI0006FE2C41|nr:tRNA lysidine(34) synthetase TilS [Mesorhizobium sp. Root552]KQZ29666.1 tRNA(Ile)-lysidine synthetase [Mesorhizobium sp. Root552]